MSLPEELFLYPSGYTGEVPRACQISYLRCLDSEWTFMVFLSFVSFLNDICLELLTRHHSAEESARSVLLTRRAAKRDAGDDQIHQQALQRIKCGALSPSMLY